MSDTQDAKLRDSVEHLVEAARVLETSVAAIAHASTRQLAADARPAEYRPAVAPLAAAATDPVLTDGQRLVCERVINAFETGTVQGRYDAISIFNDGPNRIRQITYGRSQTTEYGNLRKLVKMYVDNGGQFADELRPYVPLVGRTALVDDAQFKQLLKRAGREDPVMRSTQDVFFDEVYFQPALRWAGSNGFARALSVLVIYDSFIHSGGILDFLRARFPERPPARGGDERTWIRQYVDVRHAWLTNNSNPQVRPSAYRTRDLAREIARENWDLQMLPINAHGVSVDDRESGMGATGFEDDDIPYLGGGAVAPASSEEVIWSEAEFPTGLSAAAVGSAAVLASQIAAEPRITLATAHVSGIDDRATARQNILDTAAGSLAQRSSYRTAPGGTVRLDPRMLSGLLRLAQTYSFSVSEIAGGEHSPNSRHYAGVAADVNIINGRGVGADHPDVPAFRRMCADLGATEIRGPGDPHHATHVHAAWPRP
jgi:chitosanase